MIGKRMLSLWKTTSSSQISSDHSDNRFLHLQEFSDRESSTLAIKFCNLNEVEIDYNFVSRLHACYSNLLRC